MSPTLPAAEHAHARLVVVDDEPANLALLGRLLGRAGYADVTLLSDAAVLLDRLAELDPDLLVLDLQMPGLDGFEVLRRLQADLPAGELLPRLVVTADSTVATRRRALGLGAHDFLTKPIDVVDVALRVANLVRTRMLHVRLREQNDLLEERVRARTAQLERTHADLAARLALVGEYRDDDTAQHTARVGAAAERLAVALGFAPAQARLLGQAAPLHDIGKIAIPDAILLKPGSLTEAELDVIRTHPGVGAHILGGGDSDLLRLAEQVAFTHHERWDGGGYPRGLSGEAIPLAGRVVSVVDVHDALTSVRPYKRAWPAERALTHMQSLRGKHFDPDVLDVFLEQLQDQVPA
ncbi:MAG TPA: HD domain-containing phosphohydrolase [Actinomycetales bacterium]|jgi:putative two-component system response regulator